jgi:tRNA A-37 threonylcarbamoyl transferase component Bud32
MSIIPLAPGGRQEPGVNKLLKAGQARRGRLLFDITGGNRKRRLHREDMFIMKEILSTITAHHGGRRQAMIALLLMTAFVFLLLSAESSGQTPSPSPSQSDAAPQRRLHGPVTVTIFGDPYNGKVFFYDRGTGRLEKSGVTGKPVELERKPYRLVVKAHEGLFSYYTVDETYTDPQANPSTSISKTPQQHQVYRLGIIIPLIAVLVAAVSAVVFRKLLALKIDELTNTKKALADATFSTKIDGMLEKVGQYDVLERIGQGGMATVYKVKDGYGDVYALKVPHAHIFNVPEFKARFIREAEMIKTLHHPNIVRMYDYSTGEDRSMPYICMEYVTGTSLKTFMANNPSLPLKRVVRIVSDVASALGYAHSQGIVHRDIKPENIMFTGKNEIKIMDLGIARSSDAKTLTATGTTLGTPYYLAPEQIESKNVDGRADLYSLGVVFYEMICQRPPFDSEEPVNIIVMHVTQAPDPPSKYNALIPHGIERIILKMLEKRPDDRFQTAEDVVKALQPFL